MKAKLRKNSLINQEPQMVHSLTYCINSLGLSDEMWLLTAGPEVCTLMILTEFPRGKNCGSFLKKHNFVTNKSNCLTFSVASSLVCTSPSAVITVVGLLDVQITFLKCSCLLRNRRTTKTQSNIEDVAWTRSTARGRIHWSLFFSCHESHSRQLRNMHHF